MSAALVLRSIAQALPRITNFLSRQMLIYGKTKKQFLVMLFTIGSVTVLIVPSGASVRLSVFCACALTVLLSSRCALHVLEELHCSHAQVLGWCVALVAGLACFV